MELTGHSINSVRQNTVYAYSIHCFVEVKLFDHAHNFILCKLLCIVEYSRPLCDKFVSELHQNPVIVATPIPCKNVTAT